MLAANLFSGFDDGLDLPPRRVLLDTTSDAGSAFFSNLVEQQRAPAPFAFEAGPDDQLAFTLDGEPVRLFVMRDLELPELADASRRSELQRHTPNPRRQLSVSPVLVKFESLEPEIETNFSIASEVIKASSPSQIDLDVLEQSLDEMLDEQPVAPSALDSGMVSSEIPRSRRLDQPPGKDTETTDLDDDEEGGLIELRNLSFPDSALDSADARSAKIWHIDLQTAPALGSVPTPVVGPVSGPTPSPTVIPPGGPISVVAPPPVAGNPVSDPVADDGGLIRISGSTLPVSVANRSYSGLRIKLDPNVGRIRNFQIAAAPGLDNDLDDSPSSELVLSWDKSDGSDSKETKSDKDDSSGRSPSISLSGILVAGGLLLTTSTSHQDDASGDE